MQEEVYLKQILAEMSKLGMSVIYIGRDAVGSSNKTQTLFGIGIDIPTFSFGSLCTRDRIKELSDRINKFPDTTISFKIQPNEEVRSIEIKSKNGKIKTTFTCMKESVIYGREKTLEDIAGGANASPREKPPKRLNLKDTFNIGNFSSEDYSDIKDLAKMINSDTLLFESDKLTAVKITLVSELNAERGSMLLNTTINPLTDSTEFCYRYNVSDILLINNLYPTLTNIIMCNNGVLKFPTELMNIYITPIKNII